MRVTAFGVALGLLKFSDAIRFGFRRQFSGVFYRPIDPMFRIGPATWAARHFSSLDSADLCA